MAIKRKNRYNGVGGWRIMKKSVLAAILAGAMISCAACGSQQPTVIPEVTGTTIEGTQAASQESKTPEATQEAVNPSGEATTGAVEITLEDREGSSAPDDKQRSYTYTYQVPAITIPGNEEAQNKIQNDLNAYVDGFVEDITNGDFGTIFEGESSGVQSYQDLTLNVVRADDKVISLAWGNEGYDQGAHGWYTVRYMNYDTQTGEEITFDSLGSGFREKALELVTAKAAEMQASENCFFDDYEKNIKLVVLDGTEDMNAIYKEIYGDLEGVEYDYGESTPTFCITKDGFTFESGQYVLQSYAVGIIDFDFSVSDFGDTLTADIF